MTDIDPKGIVDPIVALRKALDDCRARLHEVEAERDAYMRAYDHHLKATETALAERDAALADAITPQQRAVLEAAVWFVRMVNSGGPDGGDLDEAVQQDLLAAVDALPESER